MHPAKETIVHDLQAKLNASPFLFIADYTGLKVGQFAELRTRLWNAGARCHVVKNTFLRRAAIDIAQGNAMLFARLSTIFVARAFGKKTAEDAMLGVKHRQMMVSDYF